MMALFVPPLCVLFMLCLALWVQANTGEQCIPGYQYSVGGLTMPRLDNEPCGVEVPVIGHTGPGVIQRGQLTPLSVDFMAGHGVNPVPLCDFSVWLTNAAIADFSASRTVFEISDDATTWFSINRPRK